MADRTCTKCKVTKPLTEFRKDRTKKNGIHPWCLSCMAAAKRDHYAKCRTQKAKPIKEGSMKSKLGWIERCTAIINKNPGGMTTREVLACLPDGNLNNVANGLYRATVRGLIKCDSGEYHNCVNRYYPADSVEDKPWYPLHSALSAWPATREQEFMDKEYLEAA